MKKKRGKNPLVESFSMHDKNKNDKEKTANLNT